MADKRIVLIGTKRGLFIGSAPLSPLGGGKLQVTGPHLKGDSVNCAILDQRGTPSIYAGVNSMHWGPSVHYSRNWGETWERSREQPRFEKDGKLAVEAMWQIEPAGGDQTGSLYCGVAPAALFRSSDNGETWVENKALSSHETRAKWQPGNGGLCLHTIVVDPADSKHVIIGISAVGVFESFDRGASWTLNNNGLPCCFEPGAHGVLGSCIHKIAPAAGTPLRLYQQNHVEVWRRDGHAPWAKITSNLPSNFGFPMVAHPQNRECAYVIPLAGGEFRAPKDGKLAVYRTLDGGQAWAPLSKGLPQNAFVGVLRDAFACDTHKPCGLYFGTNGGQLYQSSDEGENWTLAADLLPPVHSVKAYVV